MQLRRRKSLLCPLCFGPFVPRVFSVRLHPESAVAAGSGGAHVVGDGARGVADAPGVHGGAAGRWGCGPSDPAGVDAGASACGAVRASGGPGAGHPTEAILVRRQGPK